MQMFSLHAKVQADLTLKNQHNSPQVKLDF